MNNFFKLVLGIEVGRILAQRNLTLGRSVYLFADISKDTVIAGTVTVSNAGTPGRSFSRRKLRNHDVPCSEELSHVIIYLAAIHQQFKNLPHPYHFITACGALEAPKDFCTSDLYARDTDSMRAVRRSLKCYSALGPYTSEVSGVESSA